VSIDLLARRLRLSEHLPQPMTVAPILESEAGWAEGWAGSGLGSRRWTPEQWRAIERRQGDLLLDAGAGSGKTSVLVERFVRAVLVDGVDVSAILTITFTEKAAAELRDRIRRRLRELGADEAARQTEGAFISTIHGFCARVLRAHALSAGLDPQFTVLDRYRSDPLAALAFDDALEDLAREADGAVDLIAAHGQSTLRFTILSVYGQLRSAGAMHPRLPPCPPLADDGVDALRAAAGTVAAELGAIAEPKTRVVQALDRAQRCLELLEADPATVWPASLWPLKLPRNGAALSTDACVAYTEALEAFRTARAAREAGPVRDLLDRLLAAFGEHYERRKRAASGLDFEDLELQTHGLLTSDHELQGRYATRFASIMVDELQDTNAVQLALIESIARDNLFTVGDAQQSIYGFRHADVDLFRARGERLATAGARETLQTNFRSRPEILAALNRAFASELGESFMALRPGRLIPEDTPADEALVEMVVVDKGADWELEGVAAPWRLAEARALARRVSQLVAEGATPGEIVVLMRATTDMRAYERALESRGLATYVIGGRGYWSHPQVVDLVAYLRALANPRDEEALYGVLASPLVGASLDAVVVLGAAARASERDLWWVIREPDEALDGLGGDDRLALSAFAQWFSEQRARSARAGIEELIDAALGATGYDLAMLAMPGGTRRLANVRKLMRLGREHEDAHGPDLRGFLALLADRQAGRSPETREGEAPVEGEGLDAIRLMTIHRAKGLEFPIVCVADLGRSPGYSSEILRVSGERLGLRLARPGGGGRENALEYAALGSESRQAEEREERRLFYVAMTRARERLILSGAARFEVWQAGTGRTAGPISWIAPAFVPDLPAVIGDGGGDVEADGTHIVVRVERPEDVIETEPAPSPAPPPVQLPTVGSPAPAPVAPAPAAPPAPAATPAPGGPSPVESPHAPPVATLSYSSLGEYARCGYRFYAERVLGLPSGPAGRGAGDARPGVRSAADRGVLAHALLERLDFRRPVVPPADVIVSAAARAGLLPPPGPEECDELIALVRRFAATELCARLGRASEARREERFAFGLDAAPSHPLIVGALDVVARESHPPRTLIVDYKSDRLGDADPADVVAGAYATQRLVYALAALRGGAAQVDVAHCFLERPEVPVIASFSRAQIDELEAQLLALSAGVLERRFEVTPEPCRAVCAGCPAEGGLCSWPLAQTRREAADTLF
jgi:ATP-dependent helicase/nuclease subunit A